MRRTIVIYGIAMAALLGLLKYLEYSFIVRDIPFEFYIGTIAVMFTVLGVWVGRRLTRVKYVAASPDFELDAVELRRLGISKREYEVLELMASGLSNQEIADGAYLSINSVKTYIRSAYRKIGVQRRTQAVLWATRNGFVPSRSRVILGDP